MYTRSKPHLSIYFCWLANLWLDNDWTQQCLMRISEKKKKISRRRPPRFDLIAGNVCLDFVNTLDDRHTEPKELLEHYSDLVRFGEDTGLLEPSQADRLLKRSSTAPEPAPQGLRRARELREVIHDVFWVIISQRPVPEGALARLNEEVQAAARHLRLVPSNGSF